MRYLRLYLHFVKFSFSKAMQFRVDFFFRVLMDVVFYLIQFVFFSVIYLHTDILAGWNIEQMKIFISGYIFIDALNMTVFSNNTWWLPQHINQGDLDYYLTKPVSSLFFLSFKEFAANSFLNLIIASALVYWSISTYSGDLSSIKIFIYILLLINGTLLYFFSHFLFLMSSFWTQSPRGFADVFYSVSHTMERPDRIFKGTARFLFTYILPFSVMASYPARFLLESFSVEILITMLGMTLVLFSILLLVWKKGLSVYSSASS
jgi:ABC-2 type transport system permease protein